MPGPQEGRSDGCGRCTHRRGGRCCNTIGEDARRPTAKCHDILNRNRLRTLKRKSCLWDSYISNQERRWTNVDGNGYKRSGGARESGADKVLPARIFTPVLTGWCKRGDMWIANIRTLAEDAIGHCRPLGHHAPGRPRLSRKNNRAEKSKSEDELHRHHVERDADTWFRFVYDVLQYQPTTKLSFISPIFSLVAHDLRCLIFSNWLPVITKSWLLTRLHVDRCIMGICPMDIIRFQLNDHSLHGEVSSWFV